MTKSRISAKERYLLDEFFGLTLGATMQRSHIYRSGASEAEKRRFRAGLQTALEEIASGYKTAVDSKTHLRRLESFANRMTKEHAAALAGKKFRIGVAQKALNLYLKYLWVARRAAMPPHCPFDAIVMKEIDSGARVKWTKLRTIHEYRNLVQAAKKAAGSAPLAQWELNIYNDSKEARTSTDQER